MNFYSEPLLFQIDQQDVSGLEIKLRRGASISGTVVIESGGSMPPAPRLPEMHVVASIDLPLLQAGGSSSSSTVASDGSFRILGLAPGRAVVSAWFPLASKAGLWVDHVEHNGAMVREGIELSLGGQVTGVQVVLIQGTAVLQGQVSVVGGPLPEGFQFGRLMAQNLSNGAAVNIAVDRRGHFFLENVPAGQYELTLYPFVRQATGTASRGQELPRVKQVVTLTEGARLEVTLTLDLSSGRDHSPRGP
jgi:hypothetical protein